jgi:hypothetical protein
MIHWACKDTSEQGRVCRSVLNSPHGADELCRSGFRIISFWGPGSRRCTFDEIFGYEFFGNFYEYTCKLEVKNLIKSEQDWWIRSLAFWIKESLTQSKLNPTGVNDVKNPPPAWYVYMQTITSKEIGNLMDESVSLLGAESTNINDVVLTKIKNKLEDKKQLTNCEIETHKYVGKIYGEMPSNLKNAFPRGNKYEHVNSYTFKCTESAYHAARFLPWAHLWTDLSGNDVYNRRDAVKKAYGEDYLCGGYTGVFDLMDNIVYNKFKDDEAFKRALLNTKGAFLCETNQPHSSDERWANRCLGEGTNWLGAILMNVRRRLRDDDGEYVKTAAKRLVGGAILNALQYESTDGSEQTSTTVNVSQTATRENESEEIKRIEEVIQSRFYTPDPSNEVKDEWMALVRRASASSCRVRLDGSLRQYVKDDEEASGNSQISRVQYRRCDLAGTNTKPRGNDHRKPDWALERK